MMIHMTLQPQRDRPKQSHYFFKPSLFVTSVSFAVARSAANLRTSKAIFSLQPVHALLDHSQYRGCYRLILSHRHYLPSVSLVDTEGDMAREYQPK